MKDYGGLSLDMFLDNVDSDLYDLVSTRARSIPTPGSPCFDVSDFDPHQTHNVDIIHQTDHYSGDVTLETTHGFLRFWLNEVA